MLTTLQTYGSKPAISSHPEHSRPKLWVRASIAAVLLGLTGSDLAAEPYGGDDEDALLALYGDEETISVVTGKAQPISSAPAGATVITAEDIRAMGAVDIDDVLEAVPGLHVSRNQSYNPLYTIRGIYSTVNPQVLVLINGIPITNVFQGDRNSIWGGMPVEGIARIEVIRGPGSAVYGADAFAGVIDIITKTAEDIEGSEVGGRVGSFDTREAWALAGGNRWGYDIAFTFEYLDTNGQREKIDRDAQTLLDMDTGTEASLARGPVNQAREAIEARLNVSRGLWRFRAGLQRRSNWENGAGVQQALDPHNRFQSNRWNADLTYHDPAFAPDWDVTAQASYLDTSQEVTQDLRLYPPGSNPYPPPFDSLLPPFPDGVIGNAEVYERHYRLNFSAFYSGFRRHEVRLGTGYQRADMHKTKEEKNFDFSRNPLDCINAPDPQNPPAFCPGGPVVDVSGTPLEFLRERDRKNTYLFVQDVWDFANDWELTAGVRYDYYDDFGGTTNPRLALVWATTRTLTSKLLYGRAFRAPSFAELYNRNNPVAVGNDDLRPETIETVELAFDWRPRSDLQFGFNSFYYEWDDIIRFVPDPASGMQENVAENTGEQTGYGLELQGYWRPIRNLKLGGNYAYQQSEDQETNQDAGNAPHHQLYFQGDWEFRADWYLNSQLNFVLDRDRPPGDDRSALDNYAILDLTLRHRNRRLGIETALGVRNLLDQDAREPSQLGANPGRPPAALIPNDFPLPGRAFFGELRVMF